MVKAASDYYKSIKTRIFDSIDNATTTNHKNAVNRAVARMKLLDAVRKNPYELVLDYGKAVKPDLTEIRKLIIKDSTANLQYVGITPLRQSFIGDTEPEALACTTVGQPYEGAMGTIEKASDNALLYRPTSFMDRVETFYVVHKANSTLDPG